MLVVSAKCFYISNNVSPKCRGPSFQLCTNFTMILRSSFIRLKTNNTDGQPTRTRVPVNSFLSFLGKERSPVLPASIYRRLLPTPFILVTNFPPCRLPAASVEAGAQRGLQGSKSSPHSRVHHTPSPPSAFPTPFQKQPGLLALPAPSRAPLVFPKIIPEHSRGSAHHTQLSGSFMALWDRKVFGVGQFAFWFGPV